MHGIRIVLTLAIGLFQLGSVWAYECDTHARPYSTPIERFDINHDGTLTDIQTGLTWMRCALGQQWNGKTCVGNAESYSGQNAIAQATHINNSGGFAAHTDWRVPRLPELAGLIERQCADPRINLILFPNTPAVNFWSSSPKKGSPALGYALSFGAKGVSTINQNERSLVRLVRGRE